VYKILEKKIAIITGGTKGLGFIISKELASLGAELIIIYKSDDKNAYRNLKKIKKLSPKSKIYKLDINSKNDLNDFYKNEIGSKKIDILINNAGINKRQFMNEITEEDWDMVFNTNLKSLFFFTRKLWPNLKRAKYSKIINISSVAGQYHGPKTIHYSVSKAALNSLTKILARYGAKDKILVNAIAPGIFKTEQTLSEFKTQDAQKIIRETTLLGVPGKENDLSSLVRALIDPNQQYLTGQIISLSGGAIIQN